MKKVLFIMAIILLLNLGLVSAINQQEINTAKSLIDSKTSCKSLSDSQLEIMGEYYMEQMHPGESHELMHQMMGLKEGSEDEEQFHINMAKAIYCGEENVFGSGGMMSGGMMGMMMGGNMGYGMMGNNPFGYGYGYWSFWNIIWSLFWIGLIILVIWLIYKFIIKREGLHETPIVILKKRYAKGEINKKQFEEMKKDVGK
ncbi:SHOCT domain-containing protein [Candidatus Woesearchaeota archaeon]|nr:SHOCT domain-containing protein [Candidatus Woesearchaeota archaeon]